MSDILNDDFLIKIVEESFDIEKLKQIIHEMSITAWGNRIERPHLDRWLRNFDGSVLRNEGVEKKIALWLLINFTFYSDKEIRALCRYMYEDYIHSKLLQYDSVGFMSKDSITKKIQHIIDSTVFLPLGNPSESGTNILYFFRQENGLSKQSFVLSDGVEYENAVFIDDVTISGSQASLYIKDKCFNTKNNFILTFIATDEAIQYLSQEQTEFKLIYSILLDDRSKCFSTNSFVFSGIRSGCILSLAKKMCEGYGNLIFPSNPLGFGNGQYLFGFFYNTPDNTLPIIWGNVGKWMPIFPRYDKKYGQSEADINESKYY
ncbi:MAG: hypothetical protein GX137_07120 [Thermoplasmatales archaeon]|jgi:hypothetical protein|nr:hypothetical protein [Thermoplasmatales archaeon]